MGDKWSGWVRGWMWFPGGRAGHLCGLEGVSFGRRRGLWGGTVFCSELHLCLCAPGHYPWCVSAIHALVFFAKELNKDKGLQTGRSMINTTGGSRVRVRGSSPPLKTKGSDIGS